MKLHNQFKIVKKPIDYLHQLEWNNKLAVGVSRELILSHAGERRNRQDDIYCFEHSNIIFEHPLSLLTPIDFHLLNELNSFIERANENGLIINWLNQYGTFRDRRHTFHTENFVYVAEDAKYILYLCFCILCVAFIILIIENIVYKMVNGLHPQPFWRFIEMCIDPNRYFFLETSNWGT